jgi:putative ATP-binding protein
MDSNTGIIEEFDAKIAELKLSNFMIFHQLNLQFSKGINIISGENSTGKTALLKLLYASLKAMVMAGKDRNVSADTNVQHFVSKFQGVFRPDAFRIGRLVSRRQGVNTAAVEILFFNQKKCKFEFTTRHEKSMNLAYNSELSSILSDPVYLPPKEIISSAENFGSLYRDYQIAFEETYADLCYLLEKPLKKGPNKKEQNIVLEKFESILNGRVIQKDKKFYLNVNGAGNFEMGLVSEGYRKLATIMYLIQSDSLNRNSVVFWDEPESNMNPKLIWPIAKALRELSNMGVQIFISTHSYFVQQAFDLLAREGKASDIKFFSLYRDEDDGELRAEVTDFTSDLQHNAVMEEFDAIYDREQDCFYQDYN